MTSNWLREGYFLTVHFGSYAWKLEKILIINSKKLNFIWGHTNGVLLGRGMIKSSKRRIPFRSKLNCAYVKRRNFNWAWTRREKGSTFLTSANFCSGKETGAYFLHEFMKNYPLIFPYIATTCNYCMNSIFQHGKIYKIIRKSFQSFSNIFSIFSTSMEMTKTRKLRIKFHLYSHTLLTNPRNSLFWSNIFFIVGWSWCCFCLWYSRTEVFLPPWSEFNIKISWLRGKYTFIYLNLPPPSAFIQQLDFLTITAGLRGKKGKYLRNVRKRVEVCLLLRENRNT